LVSKKRACEGSDTEPATTARSLNGSVSAMAEATLELEVCGHI